MSFSFCAIYCTLSIINLKVLVPLRALRQYAEQMKQIVIQPQAVGFCRFHQRIDDCTRFRALGCIGKEPSLPANDKRTDGVFYLVVADFNLTMLKKRAEVSLLILSIGTASFSLPVGREIVFSHFQYASRTGPDFSLRCHFFRTQNTFKSNSSNDQ